MPARKVTDATHALLTGWYERVEYSINSGGIVEYRVKQVRYVALLEQLRLTAYMPASTGNSEGSNPNKGGSKPPINLAPLNLVDDIAKEAREQVRILANLGAPYDKKSRTKWSVERALTELPAMASYCEGKHLETVEKTAERAQLWVKRSRVLLGYEPREMQLANTVCHSCGGALVVARDASSDVRCAGHPEAPACGQRYPRWAWLDILNSMEMGP